jgi:hypothetical protein
LDLSLVLTDLLPALNAAATGDLVWWQVEDLYDRMDEALKTLARLHVVFAGIDNLAPLLNYSEAPYAEGAIAVIHLTWDGQSVRATSVRELEALDGQWQLASGDAPTRWTQDLGVSQTCLYPTPVSLGFMERVSAYFPPAISQANTLASAPLPLTEYFWMSTLGSARDVEGEAKMPEVAEHCANAVQLWHKVCDTYWGGGA